MNNYCSEEEVKFAKWLEICESYGIIEGWEYEPVTFKILSPVSVKDSRTKKNISLFRGLEYTPDFRFRISNKYKLSEISTFFKQPHGLIIYVDTKGGYNTYDSVAKFFIKAKILYNMKGIYVQKIDCSKFFKKKGNFHPTLTRSKVCVIAKDYFNSWQEKLL